MKTHWIRRNMLYKAYMRVKARYVAWYYGFPSKDLICYGITGTDGKSTTSEILYQVMKHGGYKTGILSTVHIDVGQGKSDNKTKLTSVSHMDFQRFLREAVNNGLTHMILEVSSHALYQSRIWPVQCAGVGITNLTREHLDFHWTMEHYCKTKFQLFRSYVRPEGMGIMPHNFAFEKLVQPIVRVKELVCFGYEDGADICVSGLVEHPLLEFNLSYKGKEAKVKTSIVGSFNADNMMIAAALADHAGVEWGDIVTGLEEFSGLPGRQEMVVSSDGVTAMIDFALTPDALATLYSAVQGMGYNRLIAVFGATGERDKGKRPVMGQVAVELCDYVIVTEDENYSENGMEIMKEIESGIDRTHFADKYEFVQDRRAAIARGLEIAQPGDIVIVTGMANFTSRGMNEGSIPWNEKEVIQEEMEKKK